MLTSSMVEDVPLCDRTGNNTGSCSVEDRNRNLSESSPALKKQKTIDDLPEKEKKKKKGEVELEDGWETDVNDYESDISPLIDWCDGEEKAKLGPYYNKVRQSKGFEADYEAPSGYDWVRRMPFEDHPNYDPAHERYFKQMKDCAHFALNEYHRRKEKKLELEELFKATKHRSMWGMKYYITLKAKDTSSASVRTYETRVLVHDYFGMRVEVFRPKTE